MSNNTTNVQKNKSLENLHKALIFVVPVLILYCVYNGNYTSALFLLLPILNYLSNIIKKQAETIKKGTNKKTRVAKLILALFLQILFLITACGIMFISLKGFLNF